MTFNSDDNSSAEPMSLADMLTPEDIAKLPADLLPDGLFQDHFENLLDTLPDDKYAGLAQTVITWVQDDENSRAEWYELEKKALVALGLANPDEELEGGTTAIHPLFIEAVEQAHTRALVELRPPNGDVVKTKILGQETPENKLQSVRVQDFMNYLYNYEMDNEFNEQDAMLFRLPISGSCFKHPYYCKRTKKFESRFVKPEDFIVPYNARDLQTVDRFTHRIFESHAVFRRNQASGFYADVAVAKPNYEQSTAIKDTELLIEGRHSNATADVANHEIYKCHCTLEIEDEYNYPMEYIVWVERESQKVIRIQRNWKPDDANQLRIVRYVHYRYSQGLGFYGYGLYHLLGGAIDANTEILRSIIDAANFATHQSGYVSQDAKLPTTKDSKGNSRYGMRKGTIKTPPLGTVQEVKSSADELRKAFFFPERKEPSPALMQTLQYLDQRTRDMAGSSGVLTGDKALANAPVGTVMALIEQGSIQFSATFARQHKAQTEEFRIMADVIAENIPEEGYPYFAGGQNSYILASDFDARIDILPVSSPDAASKSYRTIQANALAEIVSTKFPDQIEPRWVLEQVLNAMKITVPEDKWVQPQNDPVKEAQAAKLQAEAEKIKAEKANTNMDTLFSSVQAAGLVVSQQGIVPVADELNKSAGFMDENGAPITNYAGGVADTMAMPQQNTHPQFPANPAQPENAGQGINTMAMQ